MNAYPIFLYYQEEFYSQTYFNFDQADAQTYFLTLVESYLEEENTYVFLKTYSLIFCLGGISSLLPRNDGNLSLPFFGGNHLIVILDNIY